MLSNLFDFDASDILAVAAGFTLALFSEPVICWIRNKMDGKARKITKPSGKHVMYAVVALALLWSIWSTNQTQKEMKEISFSTLQTAEAVCEEQKVRKFESDGQLAILVESAQAPESQLPYDDPVRKAWGDGILKRYVGVTEQANAKRNELAKEFREHPRTEPKCVVGK